MHTEVLRRLNQKNKSECTHLKLLINWIDSLTINEPRYKSN